jgi:hypothetical protein
MDISLTGVSSWRHVFMLCHYLLDYKWLKSRSSIIEGAWPISLSEEILRLLHAVVLVRPSRLLILLA